jgi:hypothetical protein
MKCNKHILVGDNSTHGQQVTKELFVHVGLSQKCHHQDLFLCQGEARTAVDVPIQMPPASNEESHARFVRARCLAAGTDSVLCYADQERGGLSQPDVFCQHRIHIVHLFTHGISDDGVHYIKSIARGTANFARGVFLQQLQQVTIVGGSSLE